MNKAIEKLYSLVYKMKNNFINPNPTVDAKLRELAKICGK